MPPLPASYWAEKARPIPFQSPDPPPPSPTTDSTVSADTAEGDAASRPTSPHQQHEDSSVTAVTIIRGVQEKPIEAKAPAAAAEQHAGYSISVSGEQILTLFYTVVGVVEPFTTGKPSKEEEEQRETERKKHETPEQRRARIKAWFDARICDRDTIRLRATGEPDPLFLKGGLAGSAEKRASRGKEHVALEEPAPRKRQPTSRCEQDRERVRYEWEVGLLQHRLNCAREREAQRRARETLCEREKHLELRLGGPVWNRMAGRYSGGHEEEPAVRVDDIHDAVDYVPNDLEETERHWKILFGLLLVGWLVGFLCALYREWDSFWL